MRVRVLTSDKARVTPVQRLFALFGNWIEFTLTTTWAYSQLYGVDEPALETVPEMHGVGRLEPAGQ